MTDSSYRERARKWLSFFMASRWHEDDVDVLAAEFEAVANEAVSQWRRSNDKHFTESQPAWKPCDIDWKPNMVLIQKPSGAMHRLVRNTEGNWWMYDYWEGRWLRQYGPFRHEPSEWEPWPRFGDWVRHVGDKSAFQYHEGCTALLDDLEPASPPMEQGSLTRVVLPLPAPAEPPLKPMDVGFTKYPTKESLMREEHHKPVTLDGPHWDIPITWDIEPDVKRDLDLRSAVPELQKSQGVHITDAKSEKGE